jgi:hypothetical protein
MCETFDIFDQLNAPKQDGKQLIIISYRASSYSSGQHATLPPPSASIHLDQLISILLLMPDVEQFLDNQPSYRPAHRNHTNNPHPF